MKGTYTEICKGSLTLLFIMPVSVTSFEHKYFFKWEKNFIVWELVWSGLVFQHFYVTNYANWKKYSFLKSNRKCTLYKTLSVVLKHGAGSLTFVTTEGKCLCFLTGSQHWLWLSELPWTIFYSQLLGLSSSDLQLRHVYMCLPALTWTEKSVNTLSDR